MLQAQDEYVQAVAMAHKEACELNGRKAAKDERLRELLKAPHLRRVPLRAQVAGEEAGGGGSVPMPLDPTVQVPFFFLACLATVFAERNICCLPSYGMNRAGNLFSAVHGQAWSSFFFALDCAEL